MAITATLYNNTARRFANQEVSFASLRVMLLNDDASFNAAHTTLAAVAGASNVNEVSGNGWTVGGETLTNVTVTTVSTNDAMLDADDVVVTASGGPIGPAFYAVIYDDSDANDAPLVFIDFDDESGVSAGDTTDFKIIWNALGIVSWTVS